MKTMTLQRSVVVNDLIGMNLRITNKTISDLQLKSLNDCLYDSKLCLMNLFPFGDENHGKEHM